MAIEIYKSNNKNKILYTCIIEFGTFISNALDENKELMFEGD